MSETIYHKTEYNCKFCGSRGTASFDSQCDPEWFDKLYPMLACNRCSDYRVSVNGIKSAIRQTAIDLITDRLSAKYYKSLEKDLPEKESKARRLFGMLTRQLSSTVCKFHHITDNYLEEFTDILMEKPKQQHQILETFMSEQMKRVY